MQSDFTRRQGHTKKGAERRKPFRPIRALSALDAPVLAFAHREVVASTGLAETAATSEAGTSEGARDAMKSG